MRAVYFKRENRFELREVTLRPLAHNEVLVKIRACGLCGSDIKDARKVEAFTPFGHEIAGVVAEVGPNVENVRVGDTIVLESGSYDRFSPQARNGRVDLNNDGRHIFSMKDAGMGFGEYLIASDDTCVPYDGLSPAAASMIEPMGVAYDMVKSVGITLGDDVLVAGISTIGLCALRLAKLSGARRVVAIGTRGRAARDRVAAQYGCDAVLYAGDPDLEAQLARQGGFDKVLVTAPPEIIPTLMTSMRPAAALNFIGEETGVHQFVTLDFHLIHLRRLVLMATNAAPALYFPACIDLVKAGMVDLDALHTHTLRMTHFAEDFHTYLNDRENAIKAVMFNEA